MSKHSPHRTFQAEQFDQPNTPENLGAPSLCRASYSDGRRIEPGEAPEFLSIRLAVFRKFAFDGEVRQFSSNG